MPRITPEILLQMQAASKARYAMPPHIEVQEEIPKPINAVKNYEAKNDVKIKWFQPPPKKEKKEIIRVQQKPLQPFVRPPAVYSNKTPYGIASEMLQQQSKEI